MVSPRAIVPLALMLAACSTPVASTLDEPEANRVLLALDRAHVAASKEVDPAGDNKFRIVVSTDDAARALSALRSEELPRRKPEPAESKGSLVPSPAAEQAELARGVAAELERSLESIDGVLSARVHLSMPTPDPLRDAPPQRATASVLLAHRGTTPPLNESSVQKLVSGGVPGLSPSDVSVVLVARGVAPPADESVMARLGPFGVARASLRPIQATFAGMLVVVAGLAVALGLMGSRLAKLRELAQDSKARAVR